MFLNSPTKYHPLLEAKLRILNGPKSILCNKHVVFTFHLTSLPFIAYTAKGSRHLHTFTHMKEKLCHRKVIYIINGLKICPTLLETVGLRVPNRNFRDFKLFYVNLNCRICPSARCASAANAIIGDICIFNGRSVLINDLLPM
jgi:hypothetical protein